MRDRQTSINILQGYPSILWDSYSIFASTSRALVSTLRLVQHNVTDSAVQVVLILLVEALRISIRNLRTHIIHTRNSGFGDRAVLKKIAYGYIARCSDLVSNIRNAEITLRGIDYRNAMFVREKLRGIEDDLEGLNHYIDLIIEELDSKENTA
ncbi:hypothetical protein IG193_04775 [Infirmifilum lucidum]|uniref:Uncharacterized protein n=1 Tax=Infirmifilum lucidum TaxID=2776706 RepID=A0A7L9FGQ9_9CREN|nr:hypothetical protein [Infirmifilum lucidum]QOJ78106.1 hypothetical protein IG193_04775 [Infirmifilum lucidum]